MLLILEIWLTVQAWKKGWKALALLPLGVVVGICFTVGAVIGASGGSVEDLWALGLICDVTAIVILAFMCAKAPRPISVPIVPDAVTPTPDSGAEVAKAEVVSASVASR